MSDLEPAVAFCSNRLQRTASWRGVDVVAEATGTLTSDAQSFHMSIGLRVMLNGELFHTRQWSESAALLIQPWRAQTTGLLFAGLNSAKELSAILSLLAANPDLQAEA